MTFSPDQWAEVLDAAARMLVEEAKAGKAAAEITFLTIEEVSELSTLSRTTIPRKMDVEKRDGRNVVRLSVYQAWAAKNPKAKPHPLAKA